MQVNGLGPDCIETEMTRPLVEEETFSVCVRTPAARWGRVEDLVGALLFLVAPTSDFVHRPCALRGRRDVLGGVRSAECEVERRSLCVRVWFMERETCASKKSRAVL